MALTVLFNNDSESKDYAARLIIFVYFALSSFFWLMTMMLTICVCFDLLQMVQYPFKRHHKRTPIYIFVSVSLSFIFSVIKSYGAIQFYLSDQNSVNVITAYTWFELLLWFFFLFTAVYSIFVALKKLSQPGVSREVRILITKRHITYVICFLVCNLFVVVNRFHLLIDFYKVD